MNHLFRKSFLLLTILLVSLQLPFLAPKTSHASYLEQAVTVTAIDFEGEEVIETTAVEIEEGDTAWDVLQKVTDDIDAQIHDEYGAFINAIKGKYSDWDTYQNWWSFIVNGNFASSGVSSYVVNNGDNLLFLLTDNDNHEIDVTVSATDAEGNILIDDMKVQLAPNATVYDAIVQAAVQSGITLEVSIHSQWLTFINDMNNSKTRENEFWSLSVNDESLMEGAVVAKVERGDVISLQLTSFDMEEPGEDGDNSKNDESNHEDDTKDTDKQTDGTTEQDEKTDSKPSEEQLQLLNEVQENISSLVNYVYENNLATSYNDEWWVWPLAKSGNKVPEQYVESIKEKLKENNGDFGSVMELEKVIIALSHAGVDASNFAGYQLIDKLESQLQSPKLLNEAVYGLIAINSGSYEVEPALEQSLINFILERELDKGGWTFFGKNPSVDMTAMTLIGLAPYQDENLEVANAIDRAVDYLSETQDDNGGYYDSYNGGYSSESVAQVIVGLASVGIDPTSDRFTKNLHLLEHLFLYKTEDGLYKHLVEDTNPNVFANQQAFLALVYFNEFMNGGEIPTDYEHHKVIESEEDLVIDSDDNDKKEKPEEKGTDSDVKVDKEEGKNLPNTSTNMYNLLTIGVLLFIVGLLLSFYIVNGKFNK